MNLAKYIRPEILNIETYTAVPSYWDLGDDFTKLDAGENPYGFSSKISKALGDFKYFNYYPDPEYKDLRKKIADYAGVKVENIMVGSGSDELIDLILRLVINKKDKVINCPPTFGIYSFLIKLNGGVEILVPRKEGFLLDIKGIKESLKKEVKAIIVCNPNNPTGNVCSEKEIITLLETGKLVIIDEAYFEFYRKTSLSLFKKYDNLIILRSLSKWAGIAGLRLGYVISSPFIIQQLLKIKPPYNVNLAAEIAGKISLTDLTKTKFVIQKIIEGRESVYRQLQKISYLTVYDSKANFLFIKFNCNYQRFKTYLENKKIAVRFYNSKLTGKAIRLTIGKPEQNNKVIKILKEMVCKKIAILDRDGTLIFEPQDTYQIDSLEKLKILDGVIKGLKELTKQGYELVMVSNQDGLGTDQFPRANFQVPQNKLLGILEEKGIKFKKIYICSHLPLKNCGCRKPKTGLVRKFLIENPLDNNDSFVCGDRITDKLFAKNIGIKFIPTKTNGNFYQALTEGGILL